MPTEAKANQVQELKELFETLNSKDENERESILIGQLVHDKSPLWLPFESGMHLFLSGSTGAGKTAMTMRLLESVFLRRDVSLLVLDIKAFTHELYYTLEAVAEKVRSDERPVPFWRFTNRTGHSSHLFSIFHHDFWNNLTAEQRADTIGALSGSRSSRAGWTRKIASGKKHWSRRTAATDASIASSARS